MQLIGSEFEPLTWIEIGGGFHFCDKLLGQRAILCTSVNGYLVGRPNLAMNIYWCLQNAWQQTWLMFHTEVIQIISSNFYDNN